MSFGGSNTTCACATMVASTATAAAGAGIAFVAIFLVDTCRIRSHPSLYRMVLKIVRVIY